MNAFCNDIPLTLPGTNSSHLNHWVWFRWVSSWGPAYFQVQKVSFREGSFKIPRVQIPNQRAKITQKKNEHIANPVGRFVVAPSFGKFSRLVFFHSSWLKIFDHCVDLLLPVQHVLFLGDGKYGQARKTSLFLPGRTQQVRCFCFTRKIWFARCFSNYFCPPCGSISEHLNPNHVHTHRIHVWHIYLHLVDILWEM